MFSFQKGKQLFVCRCFSFLNKHVFLTKKRLPRVLATIVNQPNNTWVQNTLDKNRTKANLATHEDTALYSTSMYRTRRWRKFQK